MVRNLALWRAPSGGKSKKDKSTRASFVYNNERCPALFLGIPSLVVKLLGLIRIYGPNAVPLFMAHR